MDRVSPDGTEIRPPFILGSFDKVAIVGEWRAGMDKTPPGWYESWWAGTGIVVFLWQSLAPACRSGERARGRIGDRMAAWSFQPPCTGFDWHTFV